MENAASEIIMPIGVIATVTMTALGFFINYMVRVNKKVDSKVEKTEFEGYKIQHDKEAAKEMQNIKDAIEQKASKVAYQKDIERINKVLDSHDEMAESLKRIEITLAENKKDITHVKSAVEKISEKVEKLPIPKIQI